MYLVTNIQSLVIKNICVLLVLCIPFLARDFRHLLLRSVKQCLDLWIFLHSFLTVRHTEQRSYLVPSCHEGLFEDQ